MKRSKGLLSHKGRGNKKRGRERKVGLSRSMQTFKSGERVHISIVPGQRASPHLKYRGKTGTIIEPRGSSYVIELKDGNKTKRVISSPIHLKKQVLK